MSALHVMDTRMSQKDYQSFFNKKTVVSFFLSFLVCLIHVHSFDGYPYSGIQGKTLQFLGDFMIKGITGGAIRLFFVISGVLFYRNYSYSATWTKLKTRIKTLVVPYLLWCTIYTVGMLLIGLTPLRSLTAIDLSFSVPNVFKGIFLNHYYKSFWFIFDLIIFTLLCPVIYTIIRNQYVGAGTLIMITILYALGIRIPETVQIAGNEFVAFWRADSIIFYLAGAYLGVHYFDLIAEKTKGKRFALLGLMGFICCGLYHVLAEKHGWPMEGAALILRMALWCVSVWWMFDFLSFEEKPVWYCKYSFMMYAMNFYLGVYISRILFIILPRHQVFSLINFAVTVIVELVLMLGISHLLNKYCPKVYSLLTGER